MLAYQQKESTARVASIMENTNLSKQQQVSEIMRQMLTQAQTAGQYLAHNLGKDRKSGSAGMPRPTSYAVFCLIKKRGILRLAVRALYRIHAAPGSANGESAEM